MSSTAAIYNPTRLDELDDVTDGSGYAKRTGTDTAFVSSIPTTDIAAFDVAVSDSMASAMTLKADLVAGLVPSNQLPSYVDDVLEFANLAAFPGSGTTGKIYVALDTNKTYRWSGSTYIEVSPSSITSVNGQTGAVTLTAALVGAVTRAAWGIVSVKDPAFGAVGNGSTNDTAAIAAAIAYAVANSLKVIYFPGSSGSYPTDPITTISAGMTVIGDGQASVLKSRTGGHVIEITGAVNSERIRFRDFDILGTGSGSGCGIFIHDTNSQPYGMEFSGLRIRNCGRWGIAVGSLTCDASTSGANTLWSSEFRNIIIDNCGDHGIYVQNAGPTVSFENVLHWRVSRTGSFTSPLISIFGSPAGGTFDITVNVNGNSQTASGLAYNASASTIQTAMRALSNIGGSSATVYGPAGGPWLVTYATATLGFVITTTVTSHLTGGTTPTIDVMSGYGFAIFSGEVNLRNCNGVVNNFLIDGSLTGTRGGGWGYFDSQTIANIEGGNCETAEGISVFYNGARGSIKGTTFINNATGSNVALQIGYTDTPIILDNVDFPDPANPWKNVNPIHLHGQSLTPLIVRGRCATKAATDPLLSTYYDDPDLTEFTLGRWTTEVITGVQYPKATLAKIDTLLGSTIKAASEGTLLLATQSISTTGVAAVKINPDMLIGATGTNYSMLLKPAGMSITSGGIHKYISCQTTGGSEVFSVANDGTATAPTFSGAIAASGVTGTLGVTHGGTGVASVSTGNVLYATGSNTLAAGSPDTAGLVATTGTQTIGGAKTFSATMNAAAVTLSGVITGTTATFSGNISAANVGAQDVWEGTRLYFDPSDLLSLSQNTAGTGAVPGNGDLIGFISGRGFPANSGVGGSGYPSLVSSGLNSIPGMRFTAASSQRLDSNVPTMSKLVFWVVYQSWTAGDFFSATGSMAVQWSDTQFFHDAAVAAVTFTGGAKISTSKCFIAVLNYTSSSYSVYLDGVARGTDATAGCTMRSGNFRIGQGSGGYLNADVSGVGVIDLTNRSFSASDVAELYRQLKAKWGLP